MKFSIYQASRKGTRKLNQDRIGYFYSRDALLMVVADGMGGHLNGEVASQVTVKFISDTFNREAVPRLADPERFLRTVLVDAHHAVGAHARRHELPESPRTTCVACVVQDGIAHWAHVGDSRLYRLHGTELARVTRDHSLLQEQIDAGRLHPDQAPFFPERNLVTRALGAEPEVTVDIAAHEVVPGDVYLLCSDGLTEMLSDCEIRDAMVEHRRNLELVAQRLLEGAMARGGLDNISLILVGVHEVPPRAPNLIDRLKTRVRSWQS